MKSHQYCSQLAALQLRIEWCARCGSGAAWGMGCLGALVGWHSNGVLVHSMDDWSRWLLSPLPLEPSERAHLRCQFHLHLYQVWIKQALTEAPVLVYPDSATLFILDTDASGMTTCFLPCFPQPICNVFEHRSHMRRASQPSPLNTRRSRGGGGGGRKYFSMVGQNVCATWFSTHHSGNGNPHNVTLHLLHMAYEDQ